MYIMIFVVSGKGVTMNYKNWQLCFAAFFNNMTLRDDNVAIFLDPAEVWQDSVGKISKYAPY